MSARGFAQDAQELVRKLRHGGRIVSTAELSTVEIAVANGCGRMIVDDDHLGYVYLPPDAEGGR